MASAKRDLGAVGDSKERVRTVMAVVTAAVISLVVWGLVVALNVR
jgi:hypothetical protein